MPISSVRRALLIAVFRELDTDDKGYLLPSELINLQRPFLKEKHPEWSEKDILLASVDMFSAANTGNDGHLSLEEFLASFSDGYGLLPEEYVSDLEAQQGAVAGSGAAAANELRGAGATGVSIAATTGDESEGVQSPQQPRPPRIPRTGSNMGRSPGGAQSPDGAGGSPRSHHGNTSCSSSVRNDPFVQFFEEKDHVGASASVADEDDEDAGVGFSPYELSCMHAILVSLGNSGHATVAPDQLSTMLGARLLATAGPLSDQSTIKVALLMESLMSAGKKDPETEELLAAETAKAFEEDPLCLPGVRLNVSASTAPLALEYLLTHEYLESEDHRTIVECLLRLDREKTGVIDLLLAHRELTSVVRPLLAANISAEEQEKSSSAKHSNPDTSTPSNVSVDDETRNIVHAILVAAAVNSDGEVSLSDFIEMYAMEAFAIPKKYRNADSAAVTRRMDLADYSLLWAAVNQVLDVPLHHLRAALTEVVAVEGVVNDECSLNAVVNAVLKFVEDKVESAMTAHQAVSEEERAEELKASAAVQQEVVAAALQEISQILVTNPTSLKIEMMPAKDSQEVCVHRLLMYCRLPALLTILRTILLLDVRGDGKMVKPLLETALMTALTAAPRHIEPSASFRQPNDEGNVAPEDEEEIKEEVEQIAGISAERLEELVRGIILAQPEVVSNNNENKNENAKGSGSNQELDLSHFIDYLIQQCCVLLPSYTASCRVEFPKDRLVQLNELEHLRQLLDGYVYKRGSGNSNSMAASPTQYGCATEEEIRTAVQTALKSQSEDEGTLTSVVELFKQCSISKLTNSTNDNNESENEGGSTIYFDIRDAMAIIEFTTEAIAIPIEKMPLYAAAILTNRLTRKDNVRTIAKAFVLLDEKHTGELGVEELRSTLKKKIAAEKQKEGNENITEHDVSDEQVSELFQTLDLDKDGKICFEEFLSSFNRGPRGAIVTDEQLTSLSGRRRSVKEPVSNKDIVNEDAATPQRKEDSPEAHPGDVSIPSSLPPDNGMTSSLLSPNHRAQQQQDKAGLPYKIRSACKALSPGRDVSGCCVDDISVREEFARFDVNNNGYIDRREFMKAYMEMENFGLQPSPRDVERLFQNVCGDDERINIDEFAILMLRRSRM